MRVVARTSLLAIEEALLGKSSRYASFHFHLLKVLGDIIFLLDAERNVSDNRTDEMHGWGPIDGSSIWEACRKYEEAVSDMNSADLFALKAEWVSYGGPALQRWKPWFTWQSGRHASRCNKDDWRNALSTLKMLIQVICEWLKIPSINLSMWAVNSCQNEGFRLFLDGFLDQLFRLGILSVSWRWFWGEKARLAWF